MWKRGRNIGYTAKKVQEAIDKVEQWAYDWGVRLSVEKTQTVFFSRRRIEVNTKLRLYGR